MYLHWHSTMTKKSQNYAKNDTQGRTLGFFEKSPLAMCTFFAADPVAMYYFRPTDQVFRWSPSTISGLQATKPKKISVTDRKPSRDSSTPKTELPYQNAPKILKSPSAPEVKLSEKNRSPYESITDRQKEGCQYRFSPKRDRV